MIGAIVRDIIGSVYERNNIKTKAFELFTSSSFFTDDTVRSWRRRLMPGVGHLMEAQEIGRGQPRI
jgi:hypothetical protein